MLGKGWNQGPWSGGLVGEQSAEYTASTIEPRVDVFNGCPTVKKPGGMLGDAVAVYL